MLKLSQTATDNEMMHLDVFCIAAFFFVHFFFYPPLSLYQYHPSPVNLLDPSAVGASFWSCLLVNLTRQNFFCSLSLRTFLFWMVIGNSSKYIWKHTTMGHLQSCDTRQQRDTAILLPSLWFFFSDSNQFCYHI